MANHTPGPWIVIKHERFPNMREVRALDATDGYICDMEGLDNGDMPTVEANARLIAAAPELLEALKKAAEELAVIYDSCGLECVDAGIQTIAGRALDRARATIAKGEAHQ